MRILITGGAGYIGSHAAKAVSAAGFEPLVFDNLSRGHRWAVRWGPLYVGDLQDKDRISEVIRVSRPDAAMHFAASAYIGESMHDPSGYYRNNFVGTLNLLDCLRENGVKSLVFSSTCAVYGIPDVVPISENSNTSPINPYGESKLAVEKLLSWFGRAYGMRWAALRYFNAAGADLQGEIGECHDPEPHLIPLVIEAALGKRDNVSILGTDYETPDGTAIRDYIHVDDLADAHVRALQHILAGESDALTLNLGTGQGHSVRQVIELAKEISGRPIHEISTMRRAGDPPILIANPAKAEAILNWKATRSDLKTIVESALRWHSRNVRSDGIG